MIFYKRAYRGNEQPTDRADTDVSPESVPELGYDGSLILILLSPDSTMYGGGSL